MILGIAAHFDGQFIVPEEPLHLPVGQRLRLQVEVVDPPAPPFLELLRFAADLPDAPTDLSTQHHYSFD